MQWKRARIGSIFLRGTALACRVFLCAALLAACAPGGPRPTAVGPDADLVAAAPEGPAGSALQAAAAVYERSSGVRVRVELFADRVYTDTTSAALMAGSQRFDLLYLPAETLPRWAGYNALRPITASFEHLPLEPWLPPLMVDGQLYGLPTQPNPLVVWFRADLHDAAGLPNPAERWETFRANALALNAPPARYGAAVAAGSSDAGLDFAALLEGLGVQAVGGPPDYTIMIDSPAGRQALAFYAGLHADGLVAPGTEEATRADVIRALIEGRAALGIAPLLTEPSLLACMRADPSAEAGCVGLEASWLPGTGQQAVLGDLAAWAIPQPAAHPQAAESFAAWLVSEEGARAWAAGGGLPAHRALLANLPAGAPPLPAELASELSQIQTYRMVFPPVRHIDLLWEALHTAAHAASATAADKDASISAAAAAAAEIDTSTANSAGEMRQVLRQGGYIGEEE